MIRRDMLRAHNALLHVYASHGQVEKAKQLYRSMQERGPAIDAVSGSTIIAAYAKVALALHSIHHFQSSLPPSPKALARRHDLVDQHCRVYATAMCTARLM
jgi:pentatricopeptide repeat protein